MAEWICTILKEDTGLFVWVQILTSVYLFISIQIDLFFFLVCLKVVIVVFFCFSKCYIRIDNIKAFVCVWKIYPNLQTSVPRYHNIFFIESAHGTLLAPSESTTLKL